LTSHHPFRKVSQQNLEFPVTPLPVNTHPFVKVGPTKVSLMIPVFLGDGFKYFFNFHPDPWGKKIQFDYINVSNGLVQPPTSYTVPFPETKPKRT